MLRFAVLLAAACLTISTLSASTIEISANGRFSNTTAVSSFSGPDETWAFAFDVDTTPAVSNVNPGNYFDAAFSDFRYFLDGSPVAITPVDIRFFSLIQYGGFNICFTQACYFFNSPTDGFEIEGLQMYIGSTSAPTMITGEFTSASFDVFVNGEDDIQSNHHDISAETIPEPLTLLSVSAGVLVVTLVRRRWRSN